MQAVVATCGGIITWLVLLLANVPFGLSLIIGLLVFLILLVIIEVG